MLKVNGEIDSVGCVRGVIGIVGFCVVVLFLYVVISSVQVVDMIFYCRCFGVQ